MRPFPPNLRRGAALGSALIIFMLLAADGQVSLEATYYNSEASFSEEVSVDNADYSGVTILLPFDSPENLPSISSRGAGRSTEPSGSEFSHSMTSTTPEGSESISSSTRTQSGGYDWRKSAQISSDASSALLKVAGGINSGNLEASFANSDSSLDKEVTTKNSMYTFEASVTPESVKSKGVGWEPASSRGSPSAREIEFSSTIVAESLGKRVSMETDLKEKMMAVRYADYTWNDETELTGTSGSVTAVLDLEAVEGWKFVKSYIRRPTPPVNVNRPPGAQIPDMNHDPIVAGMEFTARDTDSDEDLFETRYVPESGELSLALRGARDISEIVRLCMSTRWKASL